MKRRRIIQIIILLVILFPLILWMVWLFTPKRKFVIAIIDKTTINTSGQEHISLDWILHYEKLTKTETKFYDLTQDYFGFDPGHNSQFRLKGLENFSRNQLERLSGLSDATYFTDTYGIYYNEWNPSGSQQGKIYGGMSDQDITFLSMMKEKGKLILTEFNDIGPPTPPRIRDEFENLFGIHWTGWALRYFGDLDTISNKELPSWVINKYMQQHDGKWPFHQSGIVFVNQNGRVEILENKKDLITPVPRIRTFQYGQKKFNLPHFMKYSYWIDIVTFNDSINHAIAAYEIKVNANGKEILQRSGIPDRFPAVIMHDEKDYKFYYFCGDYSDNPISYFTSYFKGITGIAWLFYDKSKSGERKSFFWEYYRPLVSHILNTEYQRINVDKTADKQNPE